MTHSISKFFAPLAAAGALMLFAAAPASAAPAQSFGSLKLLPMEHASGVQDIRHRRWHRPRCRMVKRCYRPTPWSKRRCNYTRRCY